MYPNLAFLKHDLPAIRSFRSGAQSNARIVAVVQLIRDGVFDTIITSKLCQDVPLTDPERNLLVCMLSHASVSALASSLDISLPQCEQRLSRIADSLYQWVRSIQEIVIVPAVNQTVYCPLLDARPLQILVQGDGMSTRLRNSLVAAKCNTWRQLIELDVPALMALPNFGRNCLAALKWAAREHILSTELSLVDATTRHRFGEWVAMLNAATDKSDLLG